MSRDATWVRLAHAHAYIADYPQDGCLINLRGRYDYLEAGYYASQDVQAAGGRVYPSCEEMLDAYVPPLFLAKARKAGLPTAEYYISNGYFEPPVIIDPVNPFMIRSRTVWKPGREAAVAKSMTRNFTYAICCQELPPGCRIIFARSVLGWCVAAKYRELCQRTWETFRIPLAKLRIIVSADGQMMVSDISPLPVESLGQLELNYVQERISWAT